MPINLLRIPDWVIDSLIIIGGLLEEEFSSSFSSKLVIFNVTFLLDQSVILRNKRVIEMINVIVFSEWSTYYVITRVGYFLGACIYVGNTSLIHVHHFTRGVARACVYGR